MRAVGQKLVEFVRGAVARASSERSAGSVERVASAAEQRQASRVPSMTDPLPVRPSQDRSRANVERSFLTAAAVPRPPQGVQSLLGEASSSVQGEQCWQQSALYKTTQQIAPGHATSSSAEEEPLRQQSLTNKMTLPSAPGSPAFQQSLYAGARQMASLSGAAATNASAVQEAIHEATTRLEHFYTSFNQAFADAKSIDEISELVQREKVELQKQCDKLRQLSTLGSAKTSPQELAQKLHTLNELQVAKQLIEDFETLQSKFADPMPNGVANGIATGAANSRALSSVFNAPACREIYEETLARVNSRPDIKKAMTLEELEKLGIDICQEADHWKGDEYKQCAGRRSGLTAEQAKTLVAYTHPDYGYFRFPNNVARMNVSKHLSAIQRFVEPFHQLIADAQNALKNNPVFHKVGITLYKGVHSHNSLARDELLASYKNYGMTRSRNPGEQWNIPTPHAMSASSEIDEAYVYRHNYDTLIVYENVTATDVSQFNPKSIDDRPLRAGTGDESDPESLSREYAHQKEHLIARGTTFNLVSVQKDAFTCDKEDSGEKNVSINKITLTQHSDALGKKDR